MNKKSSVIILSIVFLMIILPLASADGELYFSDLGLTIPQGDCFNIQLPCNNCSYMNLSISFPNGTVIVENEGMTNLYSSYSYNYTFCDTDTLGTHFLITNYDEDGIYLYSDINFLKVTPNGLELTTSNALINIGLLILLVIFLAFSIAIFFKYDNNLLAKVGMFGLSYLLLIAITFVAWNMASDFLVSSPFLIDMFRILFFVLVIGFFPLLIGAFAWYFILITKIKEIERLMKHGFSESEASDRVNRRKHGKK